MPRSYVAVIHRDGSGIGFTVPGIPGFTAQIETDDADAARGEAGEVLSNHLHVMMKAGETPPWPRDISSLRDDASLADELNSESELTTLQAEIF